MPGENGLMEKEPIRRRRPRKTPEQIQAILQAYQNSSQTRRQFAQESGVGLSTLGKWLKQHRPANKPSRLVEVPNPLGQSRVIGRLRFPNGLVLELEAGFEAEPFARLAQRLMVS